MNTKFSYHSLIVLFLGIFFAGSMAAQVEHAEGEKNLTHVFQLRENKDYNSAIALLDSLMPQLQDKAGMMLLKGDMLLQATRFKDAAVVYENQFEETPFRKNVLINWSYATFMGGNAKKALDIAHKAYLENQSDGGAIVNYFNALLWNAKAGKASMFFADNHQHLSQEQSSILLARLYTTKGDFKEGLKLYGELCDTIHNIHYINEFTSVMNSKRFWHASETAIKSYKSYLNDADYQQLKSGLSPAYQNHAGLETDFVKDSGGNLRFSTLALYRTPDIKKWPLAFALGQEKYYSPLSTTTAAYNFRVLSEKSWSLAFKTRMEAAFNAIKPSEQADFNIYTGRIAMVYQPHDRRMISLYALRDYLNFTEEITSTKISRQQYGYESHVMFGPRMGVFSYGNMAFFSDQNQKTDVFVSLYGVANKKPIIKTGLNFNYVSFKIPTILYFSPSSYQNGSLFVDVEDKLSAKFPLHYLVQAGFGYQIIETADLQPTFRLSVELKSTYKNFAFRVSAGGSNVMSAIGTGYTYSQYKLAVDYAF